MPANTTGTVVDKVETRSYINEQKNTLTKSDPYLLERIVGYLEYQNALSRLDRLIQSCDQYELGAVDEIVRSEPEFRIYTELAHRLRIAPAIVGAPEVEREPRHGIFWVTALARVELAAMMAGFSEHPDPFLAMAGVGYDAEPYRMLIADGARVHAWSLLQDPVFAQVRRTAIPNPVTLAYLRRLNIADGFANAMRRLSFVQNDAVTVGEATDYGTRIGEARLALNEKIIAYLSQVRRTSTNAGLGMRYAELSELCRNGVCREFPVK